jgi:DNA-binding transcriptional LysR family regulator
MHMTRLPDLEAWAIFARVAESGSFSGAAASLGLSKAAVSKAVARLEARIGTRLLNRTSRRLSLTEAGRLLSEQAGRLLAEAAGLESRAMAEAEAPAGLVRIAAPMSFGIAHVAPVLPDLLQANPGLTIDLQLSDSLSDITGGGFDLGLRIAALADSSLRARRICQVRRFLVGTPGYVARHGEPAHPADLLSHACFGYTYLATGESWRFLNPAGEAFSLRPSGQLRANNGEALLPAVLAGLGVAVLPEFMLCDLLRAGRLKPLMPDWSLPPVALNVVSPPGVPRAARVTAVIEFLVRRLARASWARDADAG